MKKTSLILMAFFIISIVTCNAQNGINFIPKQLIKEIQNQFKCDNPTLVELENNSDLVIDTINQKYFKIINSTQIGFVYVGRVKTCRAGVCASPDKFKSNDSYEFFDYFILFDTFTRILSVNIFNYEASHGQEITVKKWLKQFVGYDGNEELNVGKNIDAISGATISVHSITFDISYKTEMLKKIVTENNNGKIK
jgi:hypothetical protein